MIDLRLLLNCRAALARSVATVAAATLLMSFVLGSGLAQEPSCEFKVQLGDGEQASGSFCGDSTPSPISPEEAYVYQGIKYATADRWSAPVLVTSYPDETPATDFGSSCPQEAENIVGIRSTDEDCLYLNIWTPQPGNTNGTVGDPYPVMVFIYGGAFVFGSSSQPVYDGTVFAADQNVVLVTFNYRLGAFGALYVNPDGTVANPSSPPFNGGNFGISDQIAALQWVQANIRAFGGNPENVTIFGESAGAMSVGLLATSIPSVASTQLFNQAIMESNPLGYRYPTATLPSSGQSVAQIEAAAIIGCINTEINAGINGPTECGPPATSLTATPSAQQILDAQGLYTQGGPSSAAVEVILEVHLPGLLPFAPILDGTFITEQPSTALEADTGVRLMFGFNANEGVPFADAFYESGTADPSAVYDAGVGAAFGTRSVNIFFNNKYSGSGPVNYGFEAGPYTALADLLTDYAFVCGNLAIKGPQDQTAWAYAFTEVSSVYITDPPDAEQPLCGSNNGPGTNNGNVCHGAELPYVFNSFHALTLSNDPDTADKDLAAIMNTAWANFAKNPSSSPISGWQPWGGSTSQTVFQLNNANLGQPITPYTTSDCSFWGTIDTEAQPFIGAASLEQQ